MATINEQLLTAVIGFGPAHEAGASVNTPELPFGNDHEGSEVGEETTCPDG